SAEEVVQVTDRNQSDVGIIARNILVAQAAERAPKFEIVDQTPCSAVFEKRLFRDSPARRGRREEAPATIRCKTRGTVVATAEFNEVTLLVVVISPAKDSHQCVFTLTTTHTGDDGTIIISTHQVEVVDIGNNQVFAECLNAFGMPCFVVETTHGR